MNAQEKQIKFDWLWKLVKPMLISILNEFGKEWLKDKIEDLMNGGDEEVEPLTDRTCNGVNRPAPQTPNGSWKCTVNGWEWVEAT